MKTDKITSILLLCFLFFSGCNEDDQIESHTIQPIKIAEGTISSNKILSQETLVISNEKEWMEMIMTMEAVDNNILNYFSETEVDFNNFQVIALFEEVKPHTGYYIYISDIIESQDNITIMVESGNTEEGYTVLSQPFYIAKIKRNDKRFIFQVKEQR